MVASKISAMSSGPNRLRNATIVDAPKGQLLPYSFMPMKYCRYGFSLMCLTTHSSLHFKRCLISRAPKAILAGCAGCPLFTNCAAYRCSTVSQGTSAASFTQSFSGSSVPYGNTKSSIRSWLLSLYMYSTIPMQAFCGLFSVLPFSYYIIFLPVFLVFQWALGCGVKPK